MISIIVPVLNEAKNIGPLLRHLDTQLKNPEEAEVLIVDGGSTDGTPAIAESFIGNLKYTLVCIPSAPGRASQMNKGAKQARGSILYFLHVDSLPPAGFDAKIKEYVAMGHLAGCFRMQFDDNHILLRFCQWFTRINMKFCRGGDQSLFIDSAKFNECLLCGLNRPSTGGTSAETGYGQSRTALTSNGSFVPSPLSSKTPVRDRCMTRRQQITLPTE